MDVSYQIINVCTELANNANDVNNVHNSDEMNTSSPHVVRPWLEQFYTGTSLGF